MKKIMMFAFLLSLGFFFSDFTPKKSKKCKENAKKVKKLRKSGAIKM